MNALRGLKLTTALVALGALALAAPVSAAPRLSDAMPTIHQLGIFSGSNGNGNGNGKGGGKGASVNLTYHGGTSDGAAGIVGVESEPTVYLVLWGSQWNGNDPSGEEATLEQFLSSVGGSSWNSTVTQYNAGNPSKVFATVWSDGASAAPKRPSQAQLAAEAVSAAAHFGNTTAVSNADAQYVIATATGDNPSGFGSSYCAWHSSVSTAAGDISYTNLPYITDAGASCGANFNGLGPDAGITIVEGHEFAESETDPFPSTGWLDASGAELGDKCAWSTATANVSFGKSTFPVQPLWSNAISGCAIPS